MAGLRKLLMTQVLKQLRKRKGPKDMPIDVRRRNLLKMTSLIPQDGQVVVESVDDPGVVGEWHSPQGGRADAALLYLHGGGYAIGSAETHRTLVSRISRSVGVPALALDYRLAPEHPFPAALDDGLAAYRWLLDRGLAARQVVVAGDSAGGGLALAIMLRARDEGWPLPAGAALLSPWVDLAGSGETNQTLAEADPVLWPETVELMASYYLGDKDRKLPLASPLYADLQGLPPMLVQVGSEEILLDDSRRLAQRGSQAGVEVELQVWEGMFHVWQFVAPVLPEATEAIAVIGNFLRDRLIRS